MVLKVTKAVSVWGRAVVSVWVVGPGDHWLTRSCGHRHCPAAGDRTVLHIANPGEDPN